MQQKWQTINNIRKCNALIYSFRVLSEHAFRAHTSSRIRLLHTSDQVAEVRVNKLGTTLSLFIPSESCLRVVDELANCPGNLRSLANCDCRRTLFTF